MKKLPQHTIKFNEAFGLNYAVNHDSLVHPVNSQVADTHDDFTTDIINFSRRQIKPTSMAPEIKQPIGGRILSPKANSHALSFSATGQTKKRPSKGNNQIEVVAKPQKSVAKQVINGTRSLTRTQSNFQQSQNTSRVTDTLETIKALNTQVKIKKQSVQQNRSKAEMPETPSRNKKNEKGVQMRKQLCSYDQEYKSVMDIDQLKQKNRYQL